MRKGWHAVWDAATANGKGRSGGSSAGAYVGPDHARRTYGWGTMAVSGWARKSRVHVASIYNEHEGDICQPGHLPSEEYATLLGAHILRV